MLWSSRCIVPRRVMCPPRFLLVMDGLAQLECAHRTVPGLQGPRVNLTNRWVTRHTASCPLAGVVGARFSRARFQHDICATEHGEDADAVESGPEVEGASGRVPPGLLVS